MLALRSNTVSLRLLVVVWLLSLVAGCSWFGREEGLLLNPKDDYLDAKELGELQLPNDLRGLADTDPFPIPSTPEQPNAKFYPGRPPLPDALYGPSDSRGQVRIQRLGERRWLVIPEPPTTAWPKLKQFFAENGVPLVFDAPNEGRLNTGWLQIDNVGYRDVVRALTKDAKFDQPLTTGQDRYLIKVEQGLRVGTTEVHVRHENDSVSLPVRDDVKLIDVLTSHVKGAEADLLNEIGAYIAAKVSETTVSRVALQIGSNKKAEIVRTSQGYPVMKLFLDFERAWATLGQALDKAEVEVSELDREAGVFHVSLSDELFAEGGGKKGLFCRLTFSCGRGKTTYDLQIQIDSQSEREFAVKVLDEEDGSPADPDLSQQLLVLLREFAV